MKSQKTVKWTDIDLLEDEQQLYQRPSGGYAAKSRDPEIDLSWCEFTDYG